jgi:hypothetical protein
MSGLALSSRARMVVDPSDTPKIESSPSSIGSSELRVIAPAGSLIVCGPRVVVACVIAQRNVPVEPSSSVEVTRYSSACAAGMHQHAAAKIAQHTRAERSLHCFKIGLPPDPMIMSSWGENWRGMANSKLPSSALSRRAGNAADLWAGSLAALSGFIDRVGSLVQIKRPTDRRLYPLQFICPDVRYGQSSEWIKPRGGAAGESTLVSCGEIPGDKSVGAPVVGEAALEKFVRKSRATVIAQHPHPSAGHPCGCRSRLRPRRPRRNPQP